MIRCSRTQLISFGIVYSKRTLWRGSIWRKRERIVKGSVSRNTLVHRLFDIRTFLISGSAGGTSAAKLHVVRPPHPRIRGKSILSPSSTPTHATPKQDRPKPWRTHAKIPRDDVTGKHAEQTILAILEMKESGFFKQPREENGMSSLYRRE